MRLRRYTRILIPTLVFALIGGFQCSKKGSEPTDNTPTVLFPTTLGSWWTYEVVRTHIRGGAGTDDDTTIQYDTIRVVVADTVRLDSTGELATVFYHDPYIPDFYTSHLGSLYVVTTYDADPSTEDTVHTYVPMFMPRKWRGMLLTDSINPSSWRDCYLASPTNDTTYQFLRDAPQNCMKLLARCQAIHGGEVRLDCIKQGIGWFYKFHTTSSCDSHAGAAAACWRQTLVWTLLSYHIEAP